MAGYYLELSKLETMKLFGSTKNKITKVENCENVHHLEVAEVVLVYCIIVSNDYGHDVSHESCIHLFPANRLVNY